MIKHVTVGIILGNCILTGVTVCAHESLDTHKITDERVIYSVIQAGNYVSFEYPVLTEMEGYSAEVLEAVNQKFREDAENRAESEASSYEETAQWFLEEGRDDLADALTYEVTCDSVYILNYAYSVMQNHYTYSGGAHGYSWKEGYTYDMNTGELMSMGEILGCSEEIAREAVVLAYYDDIIGQVEFITEDSIREVFEDMEYWFDEEGLRVSIAPYIVASYAAGPQEVLVTQEHVANARNLG